MAWSVIFYINESGITWQRVYLFPYLSLFSRTPDLLTRSPLDPTNARIDIRITYPLKFVASEAQFNEFSSPGHFVTFPRKQLLTRAYFTGDAPLGYMLYFIVISWRREINQRAPMYGLISWYQSRIARPSRSAGFYFLCFSFFFLNVIGGRRPTSALSARAPPANVMELMSTPVGRVRAYMGDVCDARRAARRWRGGGLTRACIREGMLNRCAARARACAHAFLRPPRRASICAHVHACVRNHAVCVP